MNDAQLRRLDFGLLMAFAAVARHRNLTRAAAQMGQTQSALSHALNRLRSVFGDPLFLRTAGGVEPTVRARELMPMIDLLIETGRGVMVRPIFDPATAVGEIRIATQDYHAALFAAPLVSAIEAFAPALRPSFLPLARRGALEALNTAEIDLAIGFLPKLDERFQAESLFDQDYLLVARAGHPHGDCPWTLRDYADARHLLVSHEGDLKGIADVALERRGLSRTVVASVPYYLAALATVAESDLIVTLPRRLAQRFAPHFGLVISETPLPLRRFTVSAVRHRRDAGDERLDWVVAQMRLGGDR